MKYLVVYTGLNGQGEEKEVFGSPQMATSYIEDKLRSGVQAADIEVYALQPAQYQVEHVPVVKLGDADEAEAVAQPAAAEADAAEEPAEPDAHTPFSEEQIFSLDS